MAEMKPCPFCGGEAELYDHTRFDRKHEKLYEYFRVGCKECDLRFPKFSDSKEDAIEAWNRRAKC